MLLVELEMVSLTKQKTLKNADADREIWVIGVDRDQHEEGQLVTTT